MVVETQEPQKGMTLAIIGCGVLGTAILSGLLDSYTKSKEGGVNPRFTTFIACVNTKNSADGLETRFKDFLNCVQVLRQDNVRAMEQADVILLACKPYMAEKVLSAKGVGKALQEKLVISMLAGCNVDVLKIFIGRSHPRPSCHVVRAVCNVAAEFGESLAIIENVQIPEPMLELTEWIFRLLGKTATVERNVFDIAGVLAGPSGVFISVALDGILDGAVSQGLKRATARTMLTQSLVGLARLLEAGNTPDVLREKFASPRGTTIDGLLSLEENRVRYAFSKAAILSAHKSRNM